MSNLEYQRGTKLDSVNNPPIWVGNHAKNELTTVGRVRLSNEWFTMVWRGVVSNDEYYYYGMRTNDYCYSARPNFDCGGYCPLIDYSLSPLFYKKFFAPTARPNAITNTGDRSPDRPNTISVFPGRA